MKKTLFFILLLSTFISQAAIDSNLEKKLATCAVCHGAQGISVNPIWPNLAGQHSSYLLKELLDIKANKQRQVPVMLPTLAPLTTQDLIDISNFYAQKPAPQGKTPLKYLKRGEAIYRGGDFEKHITACIACHGPKGVGNGQAKFPLLSGQHAGYTISALKSFKEGKRKNDLNGIMQDISKRMSDEDIEAVSYYIQGLH